MLVPQLARQSEFLEAIPIHDKAAGRNRCKEKRRHAHPGHAAFNL
jgi:hypothetical protein